MEFECIGDSLELKSM